MGLFSSKKRVIIVVESVVYNLLGETEPSDWLTTVVFQYIVDNPKDKSLGDYIVGAVKTAPTINMKTFIKWANSSKYNTTIGVLTSNWVYGANLFSTEIANHILKDILKIPEDEIVSSTSSETGYYLLSDSSIVDSFNGSAYAQVKYNSFETDISIDPIQSLAINDDRATGNYKSTIELKDDGSCIIHTYYERTKGLFGSSSEWIKFGSFDETARKEAFLSQEPKIIYIAYTLVHQTATTNDYGFTEISFTKTPKGIIYVKGDGDPVLDELIKPTQTTKGSYAPYIPYRAWNHSINKKEDPEVYKLGNQAHIRIFRKTNYQELLDQINENKDINEIDFAYCVFGVPINTPYDWTKEYLWSYFRPLCKQIFTGPFESKKDFQQLSGWPHIKTVTRYSHPATGYWTSDDLYATGCRNYIHSKETQYISANLNIDITMNYIYCIELDGKVLPESKVGNIYLGTMESYWAESRVQQYHGSDSGSARHTTDTTNSGWFIGNAKLIEYDIKNKKVISKNISLPFTVNNLPSNPNEPNSDKYPYTSTKGDIKDILIFKQISNDKYQIIIIGDLTYQNNIYKNHSVWYYGDKEIERYPEDQKFSGFLIPMEYNTLNKTPIASANNCMQIANNLVFNCYVEKVVKIKWYQTGIFKIFITIVVIIVAVVITIFSFGSLSAAGAALIGTWTSIGLALGFVGTAALVAGFCVSVFGGIIIMKLLTPVLTDWFGPVMGQILSFVATVAISAGIGSLANSTATVGSTITSTLSSPAFYLGAISAVSQGYMQQIQMKMQGLNSNMTSLQQYYKNKQEELEQAYEDLLGIPNNKGQQLLTMYLAERPEEYFNRTMLTGSDIVDITQSMVYNFCENSLQLPT